MGSPRHASCDCIGVDRSPIKQYRLNDSCYFGKRLGQCGFGADSVPPSMKENDFFRRDELLKRCLLSACDRDMTGCLKQTSVMIISVRLTPTSGKPASI